MIEKLKNILFPKYTKWETLYLSQHYITYYVILMKSNIHTGEMYFKTKTIGQIEEKPNISEVYKCLNEIIIKQTKE